MAENKEREEITLLKDINEAERSSAKLIEKAQKKAADMIAEARKNSDRAIAEATEEAAKDREKAMATIKGLAIKTGEKMLNEEKTRISRLKRPSKQRVVGIFEETVSEEFKL